jgi:CheY-like chemotaxis protein
MSNRPESPRVLLIESDSEILNDLSAVLNEAHFQISYCGDAAEALERIACEPPDAVVSDAVLNELSDGDFCRQVKQQPGMKDVPVMFLSPAQTPDIIRRHDGNGGTYYLRKPCDPQILLQLLERELDLATRL